LAAARRAALAVTRFVEDRAGHHTRTAEDPLPPGLRAVLALIR
jgi:hypothetical protein